MSGPVDEYLDEMFDQLAGTGAAGRRTLTEAEDHLRAAVADGVASGVAAEQAERDAVTRFGPVAGVTRELQAAHRRRTGLAALSGAWLVAGLTVVGLGVTYLGATVGRGAQPWQYQSVVFLSSASDTGQDVSFYTQGLVQPRDTVFTGVIVLLAGAALLAGRAVLGRRSALPPTSRRFLMLAAAIFVGLGVAFAVLPATDRLFPDWQGSGLRAATIAAGVALAIAVGIGTWGLFRGRRSRAPVG
jgi:hypothetical protein